MRGCADNCATGQQIVLPIYHPIQIWESDRSFSEFLYFIRQNDYFSPRKHGKGSGESFIDRISEVEYEGTGKTYVQTGNRG